MDHEFGYGAMLKTMRLPNSCSITSGGIAC